MSKNSDIQSQISLNNAFKIIKNIFDKERISYEKEIKSLKDKVSDLEEALNKANKENMKYQERISKLKKRLIFISETVSKLDDSDFEFKKNKYCKDVLTLYFDDIVKDVEGAVMFSKEQAQSVIDFIRNNKQAETLLVHCYGGESRSRAVAAFAAKMLGADNTKYFQTGHPNRVVYDTLMEVWETS